MQFPNQMLTDKEKVERYGSIEAWAKEVFNHVDQISGSSPYNYEDELVNMQVLYDLRAGNLYADDYNRINNELGIPKGEYHPSEIKNHPIIFDICNLLLGEEQEKPFNFMAIQSNPDVVTKAADEKHKLTVMLLQAMYQEELAKTGEIQGDPQQPAPDWQGGSSFSSVEEINKHMRTTYKDDIEIQAQHALNYLAQPQVCNVKIKFDKGYDHLITSGREFYYVGSYSNEPVLRVCNPIFLRFDRSPGIDYLEDCAWVEELEIVPVSVAYERYYKELSEDDIRRLENIKGKDVLSNYNTGQIGNNLPIERVYNTGNINSFYNYNQYNGENGSTSITIKHLCWKSLRKLIVISYLDEQGQPQTSVVDESYKKTGEEISYEEYWVNEVWEATRIGGPIEDIFVNVGPRKNQHKTIDNPSKCKLPYVGLIHRGLNNSEISVVNLLRQYQYLYNVMWYRLDLAIARDHGKIMLFDIAQIPGNYDTPQWMSYLLNNGIAFVDSRKEDNKGNKLTFNQFQSIDLSISNAVAQYMGIISMIKQAAAELVGVSAERMGNIAASQPVSTVNTSIAQSNINTNYLSVAHNDCKRRVLTMLLEESQSCWIDGKKGQYMLSDMDRVLFELNESNYPYADFDVFVNNSVKDASILETIKQLSHAAMQTNQAKLSDIIKVLQSDSISQAARILQQAEFRNTEEQQQITQMNNEAALQQKQMDMQMIREKEDREDVRLDKKLAAEKENTEIKALGFAKDQDVNQNNIPDVLEVEKLREEKRKNMTNEALKAADIQNKNKKIEAELAKASLDAQMQQKEINLKEQKGSGI